MKPTAPSYHDAPPRLIGGNLCLDFLNTVEWRGDSTQCMERLTSYEELIVWADAAGIVDRTGAEICRQAASARPAAAAGIVQQAIALRENLADLLSGKSGLHTLSDINGLLRQIPREAGLIAQGDDFGWRFRGGDHLADPLWPVLWSAAALLTGGELRLLSHCHNDRCGWFFLDHSRNRSRRWCSMDSCGNRAKARRHYARHRDPGKPSEPSPQNG